MTDVSVIIPVGPRHLNIVSRAVASVAAQTVPAQIITVEDHNGLGPAWARNRAIEQAVTPWVVFLDADDELEPEYVARTAECGIDVWPNRYVYTDWSEDGRHMRADNPAWCGGGRRHLITALVPTHWIRHIGGFDEGLRYCREDTEFWWHLTRAGCCGTHLAEPLIRYHNDLQSRAHMGRHHPDYQRVDELIDERYGGIMSPCCGGNNQMQQPATGERQQGDVLAQALWHGNSKKIGRATGRVYPRTGWPRMIWVAKEDIAIMPQEFRAMTPPPEPPPPPAEPVPVRIKPRESEPRPEPGTLAHVVGMMHAHDSGELYRPKPYEPTSEAVAPPTRGQMLKQAQAALGMSNGKAQAPDPAVMTVNEAREWIAEIVETVETGEDGDVLRAFYEREKAGKARKTLLAELERGMRALELYA